MRCYKQRIASWEHNEILNWNYAMRGDETQCLKNQIPKEESPSASPTGEIPNISNPSPTAVKTITSAIKAVWEPEDNIIFLQSLQQFLGSKKQYKDQLFIRFLDFLDNQKYRLSFYNKGGSRCDDFQLKRLIGLESIEANTITSNDCLCCTYGHWFAWCYTVQKWSSKLKNSDLLSDFA